MNLAIVGCGGMGWHHAALATNCGLKVVVCADGVGKAAAALAKKYRADATKDWKEAVRRKDVDIVLVTTPTPTHGVMVRTAARARKHIFCEKPFCRTVAECQKTIDTVEQKGVKLYVGHVVRFFPEFEAMKAQVKAGKIGRPGFAKLYRGGIFPQGAAKWFRDYKKSGGVTFDSMIHDLDWLRYMFGEPERIFCQTLMSTGRTPLDYSQATLRMKSGLIATVIGTWAHPQGFRVKAEICGDAGMLQFDSENAPVSAMKRATGKNPGMIVPMSAENVSPYQLEWEDFLHWLKGEGKPRVTPQDALRAVQIAEAALESAETQRPVTL